MSLAISSPVVQECRGHRKDTPEGGRTHCRCENNLWYTPKYFLNKTHSCEMMWRVLFCIALRVVTGRLRSNLFSCITIIQLAAPSLVYLWRFTDILSNKQTQQTQSVNRSRYQVSNPQWTCQEEPGQIRKRIDRETHNSPVQALIGLKKGKQEVSLCKWEAVKLKWSQNKWVSILQDGMFSLNYFYNLPIAVLHHLDHLRHSFVYFNLYLPADSLHNLLKCLTLMKYC